jgi:Putative Flp pilus-assembly TadE/G-like
MKRLIPTTQSGQALVMIALAAIGLFAFAALAIDGSAVFSDRRHAQNAADTSALAAALAKIRGTDWHTAAFTRAKSNSYNNNGTTNIVEVNLCSETGITCDGMPTGADPTQYIRVRITSHVKLYFARIIGRSEVINYVEAVARAVPGFRQTLFGGNALVALNKTACPAMDFKGSSTTTIEGSGILVNSDCDMKNDQPTGAFNANTGSGTFNTPCVNVVGGFTMGTNTTLNSPGTDCANHTNDLSMQIVNPTVTYNRPNPCGTSAGTYNSTTHTLSPGNYSGAFPPNNAATTMDPGIYCIDAGNQGFSLQGGQTLTGNNVLIYMKSGGVSWSSGGTHLSAIQATDPDTGEPYVYNGLLLYLAPGNCSDVSITGNGDQSFIGTILAPCSNVKLTGNSSSGTTFNNQIISDTITLTGSQALTIVFDASQQWQPPIPPAIEVTQ